MALNFSFLLSAFVPLSTINYLSAIGWATADQPSTSSINLLPPLRRPGAAGTNQKPPTGATHMQPRGRRPAGQQVAATLGKRAKQIIPLLRSPEEGQGVEAKPRTRCGIL